MGTVWGHGGIWGHGDMGGHGGQGADKVGTHLSPRQRVDVGQQQQQQQQRSDGGAVAARGGHGTAPPRGPQAFYGRTAYVWGSPTAREEVMWGDGGGGGKTERLRGNTKRTRGNTERGGDTGKCGAVRRNTERVQTWEGHGETWKERVGGVGCGVM